MLPRVWLASSFHFLAQKVESLKGLRPKPFVFRLRLGLKSLVLGTKTVARRAGWPALHAPHNPKSPNSLAAASSNRRTFFTGCFGGSATARIRRDKPTVSKLRRSRKPQGKLPAHVVSGPVVRQNPRPFQTADSLRRRSSQTRTSIRLSMEGTGGSEGQGNRARFPGPPRRNPWQLPGWTGKIPKCLLQRANRIHNPIPHAVQKREECVAQTRGRRQ